MLSSSVWRGRSHWWFALGLLMGGFTSALVALTLGSLLLRPFLPTVVAVGVAGTLFALISLHEFGLVRVPLPQNGRQVPQSIAGDGGQYGALQFGFEMGTGVRTFMTSGLPHVLVVSVMLIAGPRQALAAGVAFGAGRALMTLSRHVHPDRQAWDQLLTKHDKSIRILLTVASAAPLTVIALTSL